MACTCGTCTTTNILCAQTNIPTVDNTTPICDDVYYEECIIMTKKRTAPISININDTLKKTLDTLLQYIVAQDLRIAALEE